MKVLHILNHSVPHLDGYCVRSECIVRFQAEIGIEPVVLTSPQQEPVPTEPMETINDVRYYRTLPQNQSGMPIVHELQAIRRLARRIEEVAREEAPKVLHAHSPCLWGLAAKIAASRLKLPLVYEVRGLWEEGAIDQGRLRRNSLKYRLSRALETHVTKRAAACVAISRHLIDEFQQRGVAADKCFLVPNGVHAERFRKVPRDEALAAELGINGCTLVGYVGSLYAWEGVDDLIRAAPEIVAGNPNVRFMIVGKGESAPLLDRLVKELKLDQHVRLVGAVPHANVSRYYSLLDVLVYPRRATRQTQLVTPLKPLEAMAMEKAILGSDVGGIRELVADGTGLCYRSSDVHDLARQCLALVNDPGRRRLLGAAARSHIQETRDWSNIIEKYLEVYEFAEASFRRRHS